jgi:Uma2 family endonuclease
VLSPSSRARDAGAKLADYFRIATVRHYLIVDIAGRTVIHHARVADDGIRTAILRGSGTLALDALGIAVEIGSFFP